MQGELFIKLQENITPVNGALEDGWVDAYLQWGVSFTDVSLSTLMTPAPNKAAIENKSRAQDGKRIVLGKQYVKKDERDVSLEMRIWANDKTDFWDKYNRFCSEVLDYGYVEMKTSYAIDKIFRMSYLDCTQFSEFIQEAAKFVLRLNEPDPTNRGVEDSHEND